MEIPNSTHKCEIQHLLDDTFVSTDLSCFVLSIISFRLDVKWRMNSTTFKKQKMKLRIKNKFINQISL